jgi:hypothetical protein
MIVVGSRPLDGERTPVLEDNHRHRWDDDNRGEHCHRCCCL